MILNLFVCPNCGLAYFNKPVDNKCTAAHDLFVCDEELKFIGTLTLSEYGTNDRVYGRAARNA